MRFPFLPLRRKSPPSGTRGRLRVKRNSFLDIWRASLDPMQLAVADYIIHRRNQNPFPSDTLNHTTYDYAYTQATQKLRHDCPGPCPSPKRRFFHRD